MAQASIGLHCATCQRQTLHVDSTKVNHVLHFLLGWITCAIWWVVWLLIVMGHEPRYACSQCGTLNVPPAPILALPQVRERTPEEFEAMRRRDAKQGLVIAGLAVALVAGGAGFVWLEAWFHAPTQASEAAAKAEARRHLFVDEDGGDPGERGAILREELAASNMPCAGTEKLWTDAPATWNLNCTDGHRYVIRFGAAGDIIEKRDASPTPRPRPAVRRARPMVTQDAP